MVNASTTPEIKIAPEYLGQESVRSQLYKAIEGGRLSRSLLLSGPTGSGRKSLSYRLAAGFAVAGRFNVGFDQPRSEWPADIEKAARLLEQGAHPDLILLRPEGAKREISAKAARGLQQFVSTTPSLGKGKVALIENADALNAESANAILKVLEEPRPSLAIILIAGNVASLLPTIRSRCVQFRLDRLGLDDIRSILDQQGLELAEKTCSLVDGDAGLAIELATAKVDLSAIDGAMDYLTSPVNRLLPSIASALVALEKSLSSEIVVRLLMQAIRRVYSDQASGISLDAQGAEFLSVAHARLSQRTSLSLDSTASWMDALRQLRAMMTRTPNT